MNFLAAVSNAPSVGRVFGLKDFVLPRNCSSPSVLVLNTGHDWPVYVSPGILLLLCYTATSLLKLQARWPADWVSAQAGALRPRTPRAGTGVLSSPLRPPQGKEAAGGDMELEVELTEVDQRPQGQARAPAPKEEAATQVRGAD